MGLVAALEMLHMSQNCQNPLLGFRVLLSKADDYRYYEQREKEKKKKKKSKRVKRRVANVCAMCCTMKWSTSYGVLWQESQLSDVGSAAVPVTSRLGTWTEAK